MKKQIREILTQENFQLKLQNISEQENRSFSEIEKEAIEYIQELYTEQQEFTSLFAVRVFQFVISRGYGSKVDVVPEEIRKLMKLMRRHPIAFLMTHKTYIDTAILIITLARYGMPIPLFFGGINLAFAGMKQLGKGSGLIYIRRSFKDNAVYKATLRHYLSTLIDAGEHFTWAIEGTRSRTGKIVWPKMGILKYIMEGEQESSRKIKYVPVSIVYDLIPDVKEMTEEGRGKEKKAESFTWMLNYIRKMGDQYGRAAIRFGDPVDATDYHAAIIPGQEEDSYLDKNILPRFAFELVYRANQINPVTTISLVCHVLLSHFALSKKEIESQVAKLMHFIEERKPDVLLDRGKSIGKSVQTALNLLIRNRIVQKSQSGLNAKYFLAESEYLPASYYANMSADHLYHRAFIELALIKIAEVDAETREAEFWKEIMSLRDLFKFEFFYANKEKFTEEIKEELALFDANWKEILNDTDGDIYTVLRNQSLFVSEAVLHTYLEAYQVVLQALINWDKEKEYSEKEFLQTCIFAGKEMHWLGLIRRSENTSKPFLVNGLRLMKNKKLLPNQSEGTPKRIEEMVDELQEIGQRLTRLQKHTVKTIKINPVEIPIELEVVPGSSLENLSKAIPDEEGSHIAAFFDLDRTLINDFSIKPFVRSRFLSGKMTTKEILSQFAGGVVYSLGSKDFSTLINYMALGLKGTKEQEFNDLGEDVYMEHLARAIYPESRALVASHLAKGHQVVVVSAATPYQVNPVARDLGIETVLCTRLETSNGKFTGKVAFSCWGDGKASSASEFAKENGIDMSKSYFYSDSYDDLPLFEIVGNPQATNPDNRLAQHAFVNHWPIHRFEEPLGTPLMNTLRTGLALGSFYPAVWNGVATGVANLSLRKGINASIATLGDVGTKVAGMEISIRGKENLESHRPAVFLFNHQSSVDMFIMAKLLRKDVSAIAKKELANHPLGPIFKTMGAIFIDRANKEKAIEAMKPAVDALRNGTSITIAPEGTRSKDHTLGQFKKGAFHLAMQADVPIVPVVIKNAHDALPKGKTILKPTHIDIVVLDPIDVSNWKIEELNERIAEVRGMYLKVLEQEPEVKTVLDFNPLNQKKDNTSESENSTSELKNDTSESENNTSELKNDTSKSENNTSELKNDTSKSENNTSELKNDTGESENNTSELKNDTGESENNTSELKSDTSESENSTSELKNDMSNLNQQFQQAAVDAKSLGNQSNDTLLKLYALYKQGTSGDVSGKRPGRFDFKGRAKYDAWSNLKGTNQDAAKQQYIQLVSDLA